MKNFLLVVVALIATLGLGVSMVFIVRNTYRSIKGMSSDADAAQPAETQLVEAEPAETQPAKEQPAETQPAEIQSAESGSVELLLGDVDGDGLVNAADAAEILAESSRMGVGKASTFTPEQLVAADVNEDGDVNAQDAAFILSYSAACGSGHADMGIREFVAGLAE